MLAELNLKPTLKQLQQFGFIALVAFGILGGVVLWKGGLFGFDFGSPTTTVAHVLWTVGALSGGLSVIWPRGNRPLFVLLSLVAYPIGFVVSHLALAILFFAILTPVALFFRLLGRDPLHRAWEPQRESYWLDLPEAADKRDYFRQF